MPELSIILCTARSKGCLGPDSDTHHIDMTLRSLEEQTFKDFEVIISDAADGVRDLTQEVETPLDSYSFPVKVVVPKSPFLEAKVWAVQATRNAGAEAAEADLFFYMDDCKIIPPDMLEKSMRVIRDYNWMPQVLYHRRTNGYFYDNPQFIDVNKMEGDYFKAKKAKMNFASFDNRVNILPYDFEFKTGVIKPWQMFWQHFYSTFFIRAEDFFAVNGYDEAFDGQKSADDIELGSRLQMAGLMNHCIMEDIYVYEEYHTDIDNRAFRGMEGIYCKFNMDLLWLMRFKQISKANCTDYTEEELESVARGLYSGDPNWPSEAAVNESKTLRDFWKANIIKKELKRFSNE